MTLIPGKLYRLLPIARHRDGKSYCFIYVEGDYVPGMGRIFCKTILADRLVMLVDSNIRQCPNGLELVTILVDEMTCWIVPYHLLNP